MYCEFVHARLSSMLLVFLTCLGGKVSVLVLGKKANAPQKTYTYSDARPSCLWIPLLLFSNLYIPTSLQLNCACALYVCNVNTR